MTADRIIHERVIRINCMNNKEKNYADYTAISSIEVRSNNMP